MGRELVRTLLRQPVEPVIFPTHPRGPRIGLTITLGERHNAESAQSFLHNRNRDPLVEIH
jgi:hypothetical protein